LELDVIRLRRLEYIVGTLCLDVFTISVNMSLLVFLCGLGHLDFIHLCHKMRLTFIGEGHNSTNHVVTFFTRLFTMTQDFMKLCNVIDIDVLQSLNS